MIPTHVDHAIDPVFDERSRVLMLGTMPSPASRESGFFYGHPQNRFWRVLAAVFDEPVPESIEDKRDLLLRRRIALWDVLASCDIEGASDASIRNAHPNDLSRVFEAADIQAVFATGAKAGQLYARFCQKAYGIPCVTLPSTSPANAKARLDDLVGAYRAALAPYASKEEPITLSVPQVVALEQTIAASGTPLSALMRRAGRALAKYALDEFEARREASVKRSVRSNTTSGKNEPPAETAPSTAANLPEADRRALPHVVVLCGSGNNGGDGWVAAEYLEQRGCDVRVVTPRAPEDIDAEPAHEAALHAAAQLSPASILVTPAHRELAQTLDAADIIIDAILGTGFSGDTVREPYDAWIEAANARRAKGALAVAADVPSGLSAQTGKAAEPCMKADLTVTMMTLKPGLATPYAFAFCGCVRIAPIAYIEPHLPHVLEEGGAGGRRAKNSQRSASAKAHECENANGHAAIKPASPDCKPAAAQKANAEFIRAEAEDDDGYDPYSDRRPEPEPLFERDPWA